MPVLIEAKDTDKISHFLCVKKLFKPWVILWENARCEISTQKSENCQLSDSFKDDVRGLIKLNAT